MRVLMVNTFQYPRGGSERYALDLSRMLEAAGHEVVPFGMEHARNLPSPYSRFFVPFVDFPSLLENGGWGERLRAFSRVIYYGEARRRAARLIREARPDVAHVHGIGHELSPSVLDALREGGVPAVQTLHDYGLVCPNTHFVSPDGVCERCRGKKYYRAALRRCKKGSFSASLLACVERYAHAVSRIYERAIGLFIAPSRFLQRKLREHGFSGRMIHLPNFVEIPAAPAADGRGDYFVYAGRLSALKGLPTLFDALPLCGPARLFVAGEGELDGALRRRAEREGLSGVTFLGTLDAAALRELMRGARFTVFPSECYENCPMSILESFASGAPVVASRRGAIPDLVREGRSGLLFEPGDAADLAAKIRFLLDRPAVAAEMGLAARRQVEAENRPEVHYARIMDAYRSVSS